MGLGMIFRPVIGGSVYLKAIAIEARRFQTEDLEDLNKLGDFLITCKTLVNNRGDLVSERVINKSLKVLINQLFKVWAWKQPYYESADIPVAL